MYIGMQDNYHGAVDAGLANLTVVRQLMFSNGYKT